MCCDLIEIEAKTVFSKFHFKSNVSSIGLLEGPYYVLLRHEIPLAQTKTNNKSRFLNFSQIVTLNNHRISK